MEYLDENQYFEDYLDKHLGVSKVVDENGEPLVVYHRSPNKFNTFDVNKIGTTTDTGQYGKGFYFGVENDRAEGNNVYEVFLNIRNPYNITKESRSSNIAYTYNRPFNEWTDWHKKNISKEEADLVNSKDGIIDLVEDNEFVVKNSNQIKSAIDNNGNFSKTDNNIYHSLYYSDMIPYVIPFLRDSGIAHMWGGKLRLTKYNPAAKLQLENFCNTYGLYADIKDDGVIELYETDDKDEIREHVQDMKEVNQIIRFLQQRFPGLNARWVSDAEIKKATGRSARACVKGDTVFLSY